MRRIPFVLFAVTCLIDSISAQSGLPAPEHALIVTVRSSQQATPQAPYRLELASGTRITVSVSDVHEAATAHVRQVLKTQLWQPVPAAVLFVLHVRGLRPAGKSNVEVVLQSGAVVRVRTKDIADPRLTFLRTALAEAITLKASAPQDARSAYLNELLARARQNWHPGEPVSGRQVRVKFAVQDDGRITDIEVLESGGEVLDLAARRALVLTGQLPPLPPAFTEKPLVVRLVFDVR